MIKVKSQKPIFLFALASCCLYPAVAFDRAVHSSDAVAVTPKLLGPNSKVELVLPSVHPKKFAVRNPDGEWFFVVDQNNDYSFINPEEFFIGNAFSFDAGDLKGLVFDDKAGKLLVKKLFTKSGVYLFYFADNIETGSENTFSLSYAVTYSER